MPPRELLDLSTIVERSTINIKSKLHPQGQSYELLAVVELSPYELATIDSRAQVVASIDLTKKPTEKQERDQRAALRDVVRAVCPTLEPRVLTALRDVQLLAIYGAFMGLLEEGDEGNAVGAPTTGA